MESLELKFKASSSSPLKRTKRVIPFLQKLATYDPLLPPLNKGGLGGLERSDV